jgi:protein SCO1/2
MWRTALATFSVTAAACALLWTATDGLSAFTQEAARRLDVRAQPRPLPALMLEDQNGRPIVLAGALAGERGKIVLVEFFYGRCSDVCLLLGENFSRLQTRILQGEFGPETARPPVRLLSISFDPDHDDVAGLRDYGQHFGAQDQIWKIARPTSDADTQTLLKTFGVRVIPDPSGGFVHNAAVHLVDGQGRLAGIFDFDDENAVAAAIRATP